MKYAIIPLFVLAFTVTHAQKSEPVNTGKMSVATNINISNLRTLKEVSDAYDAQEKNIEHTYDKLINDIKQNIEQVNNTIKQLEKKIKQEDVALKKEQAQQADTQASEDHQKALILSIKKLLSQVSSLKAQLPVLEGRIVELQQERQKAIAEVRKQKQKALIQFKGK